MRSMCCLRICRVAVRYWLSLAEFFSKFSVFPKLVRPQRMNNDHNLPLICRHNHQHNLSTGLTAEEVAKLPPRRHRNIKTVGITVLLCIQLIECKNSKLLKLSSCLDSLFAVPANFLDRCVRRKKNALRFLLASCSMHKFLN